MRRVTVQLAAMCAAAFLAIGCADTETSKVAPTTAPAQTGAAPTTAPAKVVATPTTAAAASGKEVVLEAESMALKGACTALTVAGAGGGKTVVFTKEGGEAKGAVTLKKGKYDVVVYVQGVSAPEDAVFITVGGGTKVRVYAEERGKVVAATKMGTDDQSFEVTVDKDGPCEIVLGFAEPNVQVDRVVLTRKD